MIARFIAALMIRYSIIAGNIDERAIKSNSLTPKFKVDHPRSGFQFYI